MSRLVVSLAGTEKEVCALLRALPSGVDLIEWRLDVMNALSVETIAALKKKSALPALFTWKQRGLKELWAFLKLSPTYLDLDWRTDPQLVSAIQARYPKLHIIASYHDFDTTPPDLERVLQAMMRFPAAVVKMATYARTSLDALKMALFVARKSREGVRIAGMCMGSYGALTRILGPILGNFFVYAAPSKGKETAPGQLTVTELMQTYRLKRLRPATPIYGLIGKPVESSLGPRCHGAMLRALGKEGIYIKIELGRDELAEAVFFLRALSFRGLSVTMPLKEEILRHLDAIAPEAKKIGAINTVALRKGKWMGYNTDGIAACDALEARGQKLIGETVVIVGAGGAAKAVAWEARRRQAHIVIFNRTTRRAQILARGVQGEGLPLSAVEALAELNCKAVIQATSIGMEPYVETAPPLPKKISKEALALDFVAYPEKTRFLREAIARGAKGVISGREVYARQAAAQIALWLEEPASKKMLIDAAYACFDQKDSSP